MCESAGGSTVSVNTYAMMKHIHRHVFESVLSASVLLVQTLKNDIKNITSDEFHNITLSHK